MFCKNCGVKLDDTVKFCPSCGSATGADASAPTTPKPAPAPAPTPAYGAGPYAAPGGPTPGYIPTPAPAPASVDKKSKIVAAVLAFFLGHLGIHNFYLGHNKKAVTQLLITLLSCFTLSFVSAIWALVDFVNILIGNTKDSRGLPLE